MNIVTKDDVMNTYNIICLAVNNEPRHKQLNIVWTITDGTVHCTFMVMNGRADDDIELVTRDMETAIKVYNIL